jgi:hypothetical protein
MRSVTAGFAFSLNEAVSLSVPKAGHCELVVPLAKQSPSSLCGNTGLLRASPLATTHKGSLRARLFALSSVIASLAFLSGEAI